MFLRSLNCFAIVLLTWFGNSCVHYQPKYYYSAWYIHPFLEFNFSSGFFGLFCLFLCFLYDKINYIVLRNESEVITQGNLRPRPLMYWPSNSEVNTSRLRSAVILLQIQSSYGESWDSSYDKSNEFQSRTNEFQLKKKDQNWKCLGLKLCNQTVNLGLTVFFHKMGARTHHNYLYLNPRNNCGTHFSAPVPFSFLNWCVPLKLLLIL